jgi:hypothetical protein
MFCKVNSREMEILFYLIAFCTVFGICFVLFAEYIFAIIEIIKHKQEGKKTWSRAKTGINYKGTTRERKDKPKERQPKNN